MWLGEFDTSSTVDFKFTTRTTTGAPTTLGGTPAISVYKANGTTESTSGVTLTVDFDARTGLNHVRIDTSSDGTFYATANDFQVVITTGTVGGTSVVGEVVGHFTLRNRAGLKPATAGRTIVVDAAGLADANMVKMGPTGSGTAQTARDIGASVLLSPGTGTGQLNITSGVVDANATKFAGQTITCSGGVTIPAATLASTTNITAGTITTVTTVTNQLTAAQIATGVWQDATAGDFTAANSVGKSIMNGVALGTGLTIAAVSGAVGSVTGNVGGNVVGSVGSVTGAVGSVTGNVGGNVVGSVASVTAAVATTSNIKKNQALTKFAFMMTDSTNHSPATGKTVTCTRSIDGAAFGAGTLANVTEIANGMYCVDFGSADLNGNVVLLRATATGCDDTVERIVTQP